MDLNRRLRTQWTESAQDWIRQDQAIRVDMLDSWMLNALGDVSGRDVIDVGCGEGRFCRLLSELGARVTGIDLTEPLIERARCLGSGRESYLIGDAENLAGIDDESFDAAVSYIVLVDLLDYRAAIDAAFRVLRPGGRFVVCIVHPMRMAVAGGWIRRGSEKLFYPLDDYTKEGPREFLMVGRKFLNIHRTLSSYVSAFLATGFVLEGLWEPVPSDEQLTAHPDFEDELRAPNFLIYSLRKPRA